MRAAIAPLMAQSESVWKHHLVPSLMPEPKLAFEHQRASACKPQPPLLLSVKETAQSPLWALGQCCWELSEDAEVSGDRCSGPSVCARCGFEQVVSERKLVAVDAAGETEVVAASSVGVGEAAIGHVAGAGAPPLVAAVLGWRRAPTAQGDSGACL